MAVGDRWAAWHGPDATFIKLNPPCYRTASLEWVLPWWPDRRVFRLAQPLDISGIQADYLSTSYFLCPFPANLHHCPFSGRLWCLHFWACPSRIPHAIFSLLA